VDRTVRSAKEESVVLVIFKLLSYWYDSKGKLAHRTTARIKLGRTRGEGTRTMLHSTVRFEARDIILM
jgi:hypothetical protein